jgi:hypothetical protein
MMLITINRKGVENEKNRIRHHQKKQEGYDNLTLQRGGDPI